MPRPTTFDWSPRAVSLLLSGASAGLSLKALGDRLGCSKHAVRSKLKQQGVPGRGSPVPPTSGRPKTPPPTRYARGSTLPPLPSEA